MAKFTDWKNEANGFLVKGMAASVIIVMFLLLMMPRFEAKANEDELDESSQVSEHIEFEMPQDEEEEIIEEEPEEDIIEDQVTETEDIDLDIEGMDIEEFEQADKATTIKSSDELGFDGVSFSNVDDASTNTPFVTYAEMPVPIKRVKPIFPDIAKSQNVQGLLILEVWVRTDGTVGNVKVVKSLQDLPGGLDDAAVDAMWQWTFKPAKSGGQPIACWVKVPLNLELEEN